MSLEGKNLQRISQNPNFEGRLILSNDIKIPEGKKDAFRAKLKEYEKRLVEQSKQVLNTSSPSPEIDIRDTIYKKKILEMLVEDDKVNIFELERILGQMPDFSTKTFNDAWKVIQNYAENSGKNNIEGTGTGLPEIK